MSDDPLAAIVQLLIRKAGHKCVSFGLQRFRQHPDVRLTLQDAITADGTDLLRSDAVRLRGEDEAAMLAATTGEDASDIAALQAILGEADAAGARDQLLTLVASQTQLLRSALLLERLRIESAKADDAARETGYQQRDHALIEGVLRQAQRRYAPSAEKALLSVLVGRYQQLPDAQRRRFVIFGLLAGALIFSAQDARATVFGLALWFAALFVLRLMAKADPKLRHVYLRHRRYRGYYPARSTPFRDNTASRGEYDT